MLIQTVHSHLGVEGFDHRVVGRPLGIGLLGRENCGLTLLWCAYAQRDTRIQSPAAELRAVIHLNRVREPSGRIDIDGFWQAMLCCGPLQYFDHTSTRQRSIDLDS